MKTKDLNSALRAPRSAFRTGVVLTMGTFDGVHLGHQAILEKTVSLAAIRKVPSLAVTFSRPPRLFFFPPEGPSLLTLLPEKVRLLKARGLRHVEVLPFGRALAGLSAEEFFDRYFLKRYRVREIVVGYNFGFGRDRRGDTRFLEARGLVHGIPVHVVPPVCLQRVPISSGRIRRALSDGDPALAERLLGYPYFLSAEVSPGDGRGRLLGFPTANLRVPDEKIVPPGVFAVRVTLPDGRTRRGMCNVGTRPTLREPSPRTSVEVHILNYSGRLLGETLKMDFLKKIRTERKFPSLRALTAQLARDERAVRRSV